MTTAHTATPIFDLPMSVSTEGSQTNKSVVVVRDKSGVRIFHDYGNSKNLEKAAFISRACNAHDDLVKALQAARLYAHGIGQATTIDLIEEIDAALAKAGAA